MVQNSTATLKRVMVLVQGSAINQDGRSSSLTAPNGISQQALIATTLQAAGLAPAAICCLAVHGTGTPLGDPIGGQII